MVIREIERAECLARIGELSALLIDAVESGASVGFLAPLDEAAADAFWREVAAALLPGRRRLLVAERDGRIAGSVQLSLPSQPNAAHRAEVMKLFVERAARGRGLGAALMAAVEALAHSLGRNLLVLDTREGDDAERLYRRLGYRAVGVVPGYARSSNGRLDGSVFMYKELGTSSA